MNEINKQKAQKRLQVRKNVRERLPKTAQNQKNREKVRQTSKNTLLRQKIALYIEQNAISKVPSHDQPYARKILEMLRKRGLLDSKKLKTYVQTALHPLSTRRLAVALKISPFLTNAANITPQKSPYNLSRYFRQKRVTPYNSPASHRNHALLRRMIAMLEAIYIHLKAAEKTHPKPKQKPEMRQNARNNSEWEAYLKSNVDSAQLKAFKSSFAKAKRYLTNPQSRFHKFLRKKLKTKTRYDAFVKKYGLTAQKIQIHHFYAKVIHESGMKARATSNPAYTKMDIGYFQLNKNQDTGEVLAKQEIQDAFFDFTHINGVRMNINNPAHNIIIGILYTKICEHKYANMDKFMKRNAGKKAPREGFTEIWPKAQKKLGRLIYNQGTIFRRLWINIARGSYYQFEAYLTGELAKKLKVPTYPVTRIAQHPSHPVAYIEPRAIKKFMEMYKNNHPVMKQNIRIPLPHTTPQKYVTMSVKALGLAIYYVRTLEGLERGKRKK